MLFVIQTECAHCFAQELTRINVALTANGVAVSKLRFCFPNAFCNFLLYKKEELFRARITLRLSDPACYRRRAQVHFRFCRSRFKIQGKRPFESFSFHGRSSAYSFLVLKKLMLSPLAGNWK